MQDNSRNPAFKQIPKKSDLSASPAKWTEAFSRAYSTCCKFSAILTPFTKTTL
jgi:hypothetical protein